MSTAILHSLPLLDATLDSATLSWLIGTLVVAIVLLILGVLATAPARRAGRAAALVKPPEAHASAPPAPVAPVAPIAPAADATPAVSEVATPATMDVVEVAEATQAPPSEVTASSPAEPATTPNIPAKPETPSAPEFAPEFFQPAIPIPVGSDFSASGPIILPSSLVSASFGIASDAAPVSSDLLMPSPAPEPTVPASADSPSSSVAGPLMPPLAPAAPTVSAASVAPFVVTPAEPVSAPAPAPASPSLNGSVGAERVPLPDAVDLFAHSYGRTNAAMLSATERAAAQRIARALHDNPLAVQLAALYAAETHRPLDALAQSLEADRRNQFERTGDRHAVSDAAALDVFAGSYGRTNAAMLSATERAAASRIVRALGDDPLAVRLAGSYASASQRSLDRLAGRIESDLRLSGRQNGHVDHHNRYHHAASTTDS